MEQFSIPPSGGRGFMNVSRQIVVTESDEDSHLKSLGPEGVARSLFMMPLNRPSAWAANSHAALGVENDHGCVREMGLAWSDSAKRCVQPWEQSADLYQQPQHNIPYTDRAASVYVPARDLALGSLGKTGSALRALAMPRNMF